MFNDIAAHFFLRFSITPFLQSFLRHLRRSIISFLSWFQTFAMFWMLYAFFWVIPRRMTFICRRFGTHCLFHLHRRIGMKDDTFWEMLGYLNEKRFGSKIAWAIGSGYFRAKPFHVKIPQHFSKLVILYTYLPMKMEQTVCSETSA